MAGYSGTPLPQKLGFKPGTRYRLVGAPPGYGRTLGPLPAGCSAGGPRAARLDLIQLFVSSEKALQRDFARLAGKLQPAGALWVSWPKKSSGVAPDITETDVRRIGLAAGLVDIKVCAVDATWSGLKFVRRLKDRPGQILPEAAPGKPPARTIWSRVGHRQGRSPRVSIERGWRGRG